MKTVERSLLGRPITSLLNAKEVEWKNLRLILVGKHSGFSNEKIRERMRKVNGV